jgi:hypothetical protein
MGTANVSRPRRDRREMLVDAGELLATLELTLAELRVFTDELREEIKQGQEE